MNIYKQQFCSFQYIQLFWVCTIIDKSNWLSNKCGDKTNNTSSYDPLLNRTNNVSRYILGDWIKLNISVLIVLLNIHIASGQTDCSSSLGNCRGCDSNVSGCNDAFANQGCEYDFIDHICKQIFCASDCRLCDGDSIKCNNDLSCRYVPDNQECRVLSAQEFSKIFYFLLNLNSFPD